MKVVLIDDHQILTDGIHRLLPESYQVAATFTQPAEALQFLSKASVDILITDFEMSELNGLELFAQARLAQPELKCILLTMHDEVHLVRKAMKAGVHGFLLKTASHQELSLALQKVSQGHSYVSVELTARLLEPESKRGLLSERELQVLQYIVKEYSNKQIADALHLSERTVETYRKNLFSKTNTNNVVGLVKYAFANRLVD
jgi:DNA-binding NarL/FixJ family response regulator